MDMEKVHILDHPLLQHKLSILRDENTGEMCIRDRPSPSNSCKSTSSVVE